MRVQSSAAASGAKSLLDVLGDEGFRLFFPLAALQAALWPALWAIVHGFDLPLARTTPPSQWHGHEMLVGAFGAALIGFITTAAPEWTGAPRLRGRPLFVLAAFWGVPRAIGLLGADALGPVAGLLDMTWLVALAGYLIIISRRAHTTLLIPFAGWIAALALAEAAIRVAFFVGDAALGQTMVRLIGFLFLGLLGLALARITVPVTNLILDPSEETSPFRPHPGRLNLPSGLVAALILGEILNFSSPATGFLAIAAGAAFLDRVGEAFVGREALRAEILALAGASALTGAGLLAIGAARLGAPLSETTALHVALMGGLGLGVLAVFSIAGLLHTGRPLRFSRLTQAAMLCLVAGAALRVLPDFALMPPPPGPPHAAASLIWAAAFLLWLRAYWPALSDPRTLGAQTC